MADLYHEIQINAAPEKVYEAITTQKGLRSWWTGDSVAEPRVGSLAEFGFMKRAIVFRMRIEELARPKRVVWTCLGNHDEWKDTRLTWEISPKDGVTTLHFTHGGWRSASSFFATCNSTWGDIDVPLEGPPRGQGPRPSLAGVESPQLG